MLGLNASLLPNLIGVLIAVIALVVAIRVEKHAPVPASIKRLSELEEEIRKLRDEVAQLKGLVARQDAEITRLRTSNEALSSTLADTAAARKAAESRLTESRTVHVGREEVLIAVTGDSGIDLDLPRLRQAATRNNFRVTRLYPVSFATLRDKINRDRAAGDPVRFLHLAAHMNDSGVLLDRLVTVQELSEVLSGIELIVLNGCESSAVADYLSASLAVISMREAIKSTDAALFTYVFWEEFFRRNFDVQTAFDATLTRVPTSVAEFVELHT